MTNIHAVILKAQLFIKKLKNLVAINKEYKKKINLTLSFLIIKKFNNILWLNFVL